MDTRWGKYDGLAAALGERWSLDGDFGEESYTNEGDGSGAILYGLERPTALSWADARGLMADHEAEWAELDALDHELLNARGLLFSWDSQGFLYGSLIATDPEYAGTVAGFHAAYAEDEDEADDV